MFLLLSVSGFGQYYSTGQDPASLKWRQIRTDRYQLIYPESFSSDAQYLSSILDLVTEHSTATLSAKVPRIPVIVHPWSVVSNGLTVWAPRRIELFPCPPQDSYSEEWLEQLAIHEYRHAVQVSKMNQGFTRALHFLFGEQATGAVLGLFLPAWFLEGDATCAETALSSAGRGRMPSFENILRAQLLEKGPYSYDKATMGSYRTFTPDAYELGYHLVAWGREKYGPYLWNQALDRTAQYPYMVVPFSSGIHSVTGLTKAQFYRKALADLQRRWSVQDSLMVLTSCRQITEPEKGNYIEYLFPVLNDSTSVIALKSDLKDPDRIVHVDLMTAKEKVIFVPGNYIKDALSVSGNLLAWSEYLPDPRWDHRNYAVIRTFDMETGRSRYLTRRSRYFFPAIAPDGSSIAAVHIDHENNCSLDLLDPGNGAVLWRYAFPDKQLVTEPTWSPEGDELLFCIVTDRGKTLAEIRPGSDSLIVLVENDRHYISGPVYLSEDTIIFTDSYSGIDNIYYLDETTRDIFQVHSSRFGAYNPNFTPRKDVLFWSAITSDGLMLMESEVEPEKWTRVDHVTNHSIRLYEAIVRQEKCNLQDSAIRLRLNELRTADDGRKTADGGRPYSKLSHLFNLHSWAPLALDAGNLSVMPGVSVSSQNVLSTMTATAGYRYRPCERTGTLYAELTYSGLYPAIGVSYEYGNAAGYREDPATGNSWRYTWNESTFSANVSIPWNFSRGKYYRYVTPRFSTGVTSYLKNRSTVEDFTAGACWYNTYSIRAANYHFTNFRDMYPRFGQTVYAVYKHGMPGRYRTGSLLACELNLYFPGIVRHHGLWIYAAAQQRWDNPDSDNLFATVISLPRGTEGFAADRLFSFSANYKLPLFCPDWSLGSVMYIKRFKLNLFYDYAGGKTSGSYRWASSVGAELTADLHLLRFLYPFEVGVRSYYSRSENRWGWDFLAGIIL